MRPLLLLLALLTLAATPSPPTVPVPLVPPAPPATPEETWDRLAECESSGDWHADTGNGYFGGLQIWPPTWEGADGLRFADRPDHASRPEQITVAEEIRERQGWGAWASCARRIGLLPP